MQAFAAERELTFTILLDESGSAANEYQVRGIPSSFLIDQQGVTRVRHTGALEETLIDKYVGQILR